MTMISPKAIVMNPEALADDVQVGPFAFIGPEVIVEAGTVIDNNVTVTGKTRIGRSCRLLPGCIVGCEPAGAYEAGGSCTIGPGNTIREHVIIESGSADGAGTKLGANNLLMVGCCVARDADLAGEGIFANFTRIGHHARIEKYVRTSGFTSIAPYATVGAYTFTTGYSGIDRDAPPYAIVQGFPFRVRNANKENLRRCGFDPKAIDALKKAFRMIFNGASAFPVSEQLRLAEQTFDDEHVAELIASLRQSAASPTGKRLQPSK
ncbi:MAG: acyl-[acyl-carrier-protein]--UDP-N-acetylglucosamine O-acyltransferase [Planctomycetota bacterium]|nr:acyl-[acyl-carrier-protein]--UDP-N-acetylglucosamine O-acyltransferase [Planctomycetota bacterium]